AATALACRSSSRSVLRIPLRNNPLVLGALVVTWALAAALVLVPPLARPLGHAPPTPRGLAFGALAFPLVLIADSLWKWRMASCFSVSGAGGGALELALLLGAELYS